MHAISWIEFREFNIGVYHLSAEHMQVQAMFKIANSTEIPPVPDHLSPDASEFILLCLQRDPLARPSAAMLLTHAFVSMNGAFAGGIPPALRSEDFDADLAAADHANRHNGMNGLLRNDPISMPWALSNAHDGQACPATPRDSWYALPRSHNRRSHCCETGHIAFRCMHGHEATISMTTTLRNKR